MTAATMEFDFVGGAGTIGAGVSAESGFKFNLEDTLSGTTPIPIPTATGQNFSFYKPMCFKCTVISSPTTNISNFTIKITSGSNPTGIRTYFKGVAQASYAQATGANNPNDDVGNNGNTPSTYTVLDTTARQWYAGPVATGSTGLKGDMVYLLLGVGYDYVGGGNSNLGLQGMTAAYDEA